MKKSIVAIIAMLLTCFCFVSSTYAWLVAKTEPLVNTFTAGNINISIGDHSATDYKLVPGLVITREPHVTVFADSEACWLFLKVEKIENIENYTFDQFITYSIDGADNADENVGWNKLDGVDGVYYRKVEAADADQEFHILQGDTLSIKSTVNKAMLDKVTTANQPQLIFTAYAVQQLGIENAADAWEQAKSLDTQP